MFAVSGEAGSVRGLDVADEFDESYAYRGPVVDLDHVGAHVAVQCYSAAFSPGLLADGDVLDVVQGADLVSRWAAGVRIRMVCEFADRHPAGSSAAPPGGDQAVPVDRWVPAEVGMTLRTARLEALAEIARAQRFVHVLPDTLACLEAGRIDERRADAIASATALLPDDKAREVEARVLTNAPDATLRQLRDRIRRAVARVDPDGAYRRHKEAVRERSVSIRSLEDGMASLWFYGPAEEIEAAWTMADRLARAPRDPEDGRTLDQRRFDMAVRVLQGRLTVTDMSDVERAVDAALDVTVSAESAAAGSDTGSDIDLGSDIDSDIRADSSDPDEGAESDEGATLPDRAVATDRATDTAIADDAATADDAGSAAGARRSGDSTSAGDATAVDAGHAAPAGSSTGGTPLRRDAAAWIDRAALTEVVTQVLGARPPLHDTIHKPQIHVVVALDTLLGSDRPAELLGHGPIDAVTARALAAGGVWARLVTDRLSGRLLDYGRAVYSPPADLDDFVRARDQICRGPGCTRKIGELDHHIQFGAGHDGSTSEPNLTGYCRACHALKHAPGWQVVAGTDRTLTWISPNGRRTVTAPYDYRAFTDPLPEPSGTADACAPNRPAPTASGTEPLTDDDAPPF